MLVDGWHEFSDPDGTVWLPGAKFRAEGGRVAEVIDPDDYVGTYSRSAVLGYVEARAWRWFRSDAGWSTRGDANVCVPRQLPTQPTHVVLYEPSTMTPWGAKRLVVVRGDKAYGRQDWTFRKEWKRPTLECADGEWRDARHHKTRVIVLEIARGV